MSTNGQAEIANAKEYLARSEAGRHVLALLGNVLTEDHIEAMAKGIAPFVKEQTQSVRQAVMEIELNIRAFVMQQERTAAEVIARMAAVEKRFVEFEAKRVAEIEQRASLLEVQLAKSLKNGGTWKAATEFEPGDVVTCKGAAWVCQVANVGEKPGSSSAWRLMHKTIDGRSP